MAQALQQVPSSGLLYSESIWHLEPRTQRKPRALEAIKKVDNDPILFVTIARIFWGERRLEKAQNWFEKAILLDSDLGDTWAWYYKFLLQHGTEVGYHQPKSQDDDANNYFQEKRADVVAKCILSEPRHGEVWQSVSKDPRNTGKTMEDLLKIVVSKLE
jgi:pre-mRNA-processing factor 6